ncbi:hypothetical protein IID24_05850 [Patescibacteria group bacterium]|nr:hypothetical protein [Patescibacteria group bacterium]
MPADQSTITVPEELKKKFPDLIALILGSESMNDEERQYWINILPVMTEDQQKNLNQILQNEKDQLSAIDEKYQKEMENLGKGKSVLEMQKKSKEKRSLRQSKESASEGEEQKKEKEILKSK